jgi:lysophospholipase
MVELVALAKNPIPSGAIAGAFKTRDGLRLRFARWEPTRGPKRGTVCLFQGRSEYIEKYFEVVADLRRRGFAVAPWTGAGRADLSTSCPTPARATCARSPSTTKTSRSS